MFLSPEAARVSPVLSRSVLLLAVTSTSMALWTIKPIAIAATRHNIATIQKLSDLKKDFLLIFVLRNLPPNSCCVGGSETSIAMD